MSDRFECAEYLSRAISLLDGEGCDIEVTIVMEHIEVCSPCADAYYVQRQVKYLVQRSAGCSVAPESLRVSVLSSIRMYRPGE